MKARFTKRFFLGWSMLVVALCLSTRLEPRQIDSQTTILEVERTPNGIVYKVDSKLTGSRPTDDLLHALNQVADQSGVNHPVFVFLDPRLSINEIWNINGVAAKAQLTNLRFFIFFRGSHKMTEIKWTPFVPLTTKPSAD